MGGQAHIIGLPKSAETSRFLISEGVNSGTIETSEGLGQQGYEIT